MKISQKGLYALQAIMTLGRRYGTATVKIRDIAMESDLPEKFLELILLELKNARIVESVRGAKGGYRLRRAPELNFVIDRSDEYSQRIERLLSEVKKPPAL